MPAMQIEELKCSFFLLLARPSIIKNDKKIKKKGYTRKDTYTASRTKQQSKYSTSIEYRVQYSNDLPLVPHQHQTQYINSNHTSASKYNTFNPIKIGKRQTNIDQVLQHSDKTTYIKHTVPTSSSKSSNIIDFSINFLIPIKRRRKRDYIGTFFFYTLHQTHQSKYQQHIGYDT